MIKHPFILIQKRTIERVVKSILCIQNYFLVSIFLCIWEDKEFSLFTKYSHLPINFLLASLYLDLPPFSERGNKSFSHEWLFGVAVMVHLLYTHSALPIEIRPFSWIKPINLIRNCLFGKLYSLEKVIFIAKILPYIWGTNIGWHIGKVGRPIYNCVILCVNHELNLNTLKAKLC